MLRLAQLRDRLAPWRPPLLFALALVAVATLPHLAYALTSARMPGDFESALRAHVAWARVVGLAIAVAGAVSLARTLRRDAGAGARPAAAAVLLCGLVAGASALPHYDAWVDARMQERYLSAGDEWRSHAWGHGPGASAFGAQIRHENHSGPLHVPLPPLKKGDYVHAYAGFEADDPEGFFQASLDPRQGNCQGWDGQSPRPPSAPPQEHHAYFVMSECTISREGARALLAQWGSEAPVNATVAVMIRPGYDRVVAARMDDSLLVASSAAAVGALAAIAAASRRNGSTLAQRRALGVLLTLGPALVCAAWLLAALLHEPFITNDASLQASRGALALLAGLATLACAGAAVAIWRSSEVPPEQAASWSALAAGAVGLLAPVAAMKMWRLDVAWVTLGVVVTMVVGALSLLGARGLRAREAPPPGDLSPG